MSSVPLSTLIEVGNDIRGTKMAFISIYAAFLYEYALTLPDEIEYIWKRKFTFVSFLFCMNRYYALAVFTVALSGFFSPLFTPDICKRYSSFLPLAVGLPMLVIPGIVMGLRVSALYSRKKLVTVALFSFLSAETGVALWIYTRSGNGPLQLPPGLHGDAFQICIQEVALGNIPAAAYQFMETIYDTIVFVMIVHKTIESIRTGKRSILTIIGAHSVLYFGVVFTCNFIWAVFIIFQPDGLKYSVAMPTIMLGCTVVNRITLELRACSATKGWFESVPHGHINEETIPFRERRSSMPSLGYARPSVGLSSATATTEDIEMSRVTMHKELDPPQV